MSRTNWLFLPVLLLLTLSPVLAYISPGQPTGFVNDYADILTPEQEATLEAKLQTLAASEGSEIAVVTIASLEEDTIENFAVSLFAEWGIGKVETDNGLLLLVAVEEREMRIEVGYGLESTITDAQSYWVIRDVLTPAFKNGDYYTGISGAVDTMTEAITGQIVLPNAEKPSPIMNEDTIGSFINYLFFIVIALAAFLGRTKSIWLGGVIGALTGIVGGLLLGTIQTAVLGGLFLGALGLLLDFIFSRGGGPSSGMGGGMFRGGGSSGGFGGFGGGSSGGGGASGRW
jgi:uncharacterized protein